MNQDKRLNLSEQPTRAVQGVGAPAVGTVTGDIADLNTALTGKSDVGHTHAHGDITGLSTVAASGAYSDLSGLPTLFDGEYDSLSGIPATFAPSSHTHATGDVAGLDTTLSEYDTRIAALESAPPPALSPSAHYLWPVPSGGYFDQAVNAMAKSTIAAAANRLDLIPFVGGVAATLQSIGIDVSTAVAASQARVGIYSDSAGLPDALLADSGLLDCSATGVKVGSVSITLAAGTRYWLAVHSSSTQTYRGVPVAALMSLSIPAAGGTTSHTLRRSTSTFASGLPSSGPSGTLTSAIAPVVIMRSA